MTVSKAQLTTAARKDVREAMGWAEAQEWKYREEPDKYTAEELKRITALQAQWESLSKQGEEEGWLEWSGGYRDGEWEVSLNQFHPTRTIKVREDKATRARRIKALDEAVEVKVAKRVERQWKALEEAQSIIAGLGK